MSVIENAVVYMKVAAADKSHGYDQGSRWGPDYGVDGDYGTETATAVRVLQQAKGPEANGVVGEQTRAARIG